MHEYGAEQGAEPEARARHAARGAIRDEKHFISPGTRKRADVCPEYGTKEYFAVLGVSPEEYFEGDRGYARVMAHRCQACVD